MGLSTAMHATCLLPQRRLLLVEKETNVACHQRNNSGVIHSGVYCKPGSLKAKLCLEGAAVMAEFCREHNPCHELCGQSDCGHKRGGDSRGSKYCWSVAKLTAWPDFVCFKKEQLRDIVLTAAALGLLVPGTGISD